MQQSCAPASPDLGHRLRILIADDHAYMLRSLRQFLEPDFEVVGEVSDGEELKRMARELAPELIVTDISMPKLSGLEAARQILAERPGTKVIFLTVHNDPELVRHSLALGAGAYVLKSHASTELINAITQVTSGHIYVSPAIQGR
jgi:DNA-binding NarL/FixJ family response regulator